MKTTRLCAVETVARQTGDRRSVVEPSELERINLRFIIYYGLWCTAREDHSGVPPEGRRDVGKDNQG